MTSHLSALTEEKKGAKSERSVSETGKLVKRTALLGLLDKLALFNQSFFSLLQRETTHEPQPYKRWLAINQLALNSSHLFYYSVLSPIRRVRERDFSYLTLKPKAFA